MQSTRFSMRFTLQPVLQTSQVLLSLLSTDHMITKYNFHDNFHDKLDLQTNIKELLLSKISSVNQGHAHIRNPCTLDPMDKMLCAKFMGYMWEFFGQISDENFFLQIQTCRELFNIRGTKFQNLNLSRFILQLSLCNVLKSGVKSTMKM